VVLAWSAVKQGAVNFADGFNVTMHEFAHQLDQEDGTADGAPILEQRSAYASWARIFLKEFQQLKRRAKKRKKSVLSRYGATNPAEFFAVATETFFEKPGQLMSRHPELYGELLGFYKVNPAEWTEAKSERQRR
jgi:Mlc titration factor MtfA (ptsG expression regulator)